VGGGYSGIAVAAGRVFTQDRKKEPSPGIERVLGLDRATGKTRWFHEYPADYGDLDHGNGPRATPTVHDGRVYTLGAMGHLFALDEKSGNVTFGIDLARQFGAKLPTWGYSASPLIHGDLLVVVAGARPGGTVIAFDRKTGKERWRALDERPGYSSPIATRIGGREEIVVWTADAASGLDPATGRVHWRAPFRTSEYDVAIISPFVEDGQLFISGYWDGTETYNLDGSPSPGVAWKNRRPSSLMADPLFHGGHLYTLDKKEGLLCLEWASGKVLWSDSHAMTPASRNPHASMVWAGEGRAAVLNSEGHLILARLSRGGYEEEGRVPIIAPTWAHPAFAGQEVFARSDAEMVCVRVKVEHCDAESLKGEADT